MNKVLVTTAPFCEFDEAPLQLLARSDIEIVENPHGRRLTEEELLTLVDDVDCIIAGTELISSRVLRRAKKLKLIARVGIGLDGIDLGEALSRGVKVTYTPDAPTAAVVELALANILNLLRSVHLANSDLHMGNWKRRFGTRIENANIGILGVGRIGSRLAKTLKMMGAKKLYLCDPIRPRHPSMSKEPYKWVKLNQLLSVSDILSIHIPLTPTNKNLIDASSFSLMKQGAMLVNTARGGIVDEDALYQNLKSGHLGGAAVDVFEQEPYYGKLSTLENCILTAHMGSMSYDCRMRMELEATDEVIRFLDKRPLRNEVTR